MYKRQEQYVETGISEQGAVDAAAGLASAGLVPFVGTYAGFLTMRACEQMRTFVAYPNLNVKFVGINSGLLGGEREGVTHQFYEDLGILSNIPNYTILTPADAAQTYHAVKMAAKIDGPVYVRAGSGREPDVYDKETPFGEEGIRILKEYGNDALLLSSGFVLDRVLLAAELLKSQGINVTVGDVNILYGKNPSKILEAIAGARKIVTAVSYTHLDVYKRQGKDSVNYVGEQLDGKGNVVVVRGVSGAAPDQGIYAGITEAMKDYPDLKIVQEVIGEASATKTQEELTKVMASLPDVDAVITHCGGDAIGAVNAFEQSGKDMPIIIGDNTAEYINWWLEQDGYETLSQGSTPGCGAAAFWTALDILNGYDVPEEMMLSVPHITKDNVGEYKGMKAGTFVSPDFTNEYVIENIIDASK